MSKKEIHANGKGHNSWTSGENKHIGDQGEYYCRSLYGLMKHPNGDRRPDLISVNGSYSPKLSMEVKASMTGRGVVNAYGLTYGFSTNLDYQSVFGASLPTQNVEELIQDMEFNTFRGLMPVALYYNLLMRTDGTHKEGFTMPYDDLRIKFGDQILLPEDVIFYSYVVGKMRGNNLSFDKAFQSVKGIVSSFFTEKGYDYSYAEKHDCQSVHFNDFLSLFLDEESLLRTDEAKERVDMFLEHYGHDRFGGLEKREYLGPNNTHIYAFYKQEHASIFQDQMKQRIASRRDILTRIIQHRDKKFDELGRKYVLQTGNHELELGINDGIKVIPKVEQSSIDRLLEYRRAEDNGYEFLDVHPAQVDNEKTDPEQATIF